MFRKRRCPCEFGLPCKRRSLHRLWLPAQDGRRDVADIFGLLLFSASLVDFIRPTTPRQEYKEQTQKKAGLLLLFDVDC